MLTGCRDECGSLGLGILDDGMLDNLQCVHCKITTTPTIILQSYTVIQKQ